MKKLLLLCFVFCSGVCAIAQKSISGTVTDEKGNALSGAVPGKPEPDPQFVAPSFNSNRQSGGDGADHIDPATLRGLEPDQTLMLINGKRRHRSSLINPLV